MERWKVTAEKQMKCQRFLHREKPNCVILLLGKGYPKTNYTLSRDDIVPYFHLTYYSPLRIANLRTWIFDPYDEYPIKQKSPLSTGIEIYSLVPFSYLP